VGLADKLMRVVKGARKLRVSRDPKSYSRYRFERDAARKRAAHERHEQQDSADHVREDAGREHDFEERYASERERDVEREQGKRADASEGGSDPS
jgi:hypothetical protein